MNSQHRIILFILLLYAVSAGAGSAENIYKFHFQHRGDLFLSSYKDNTQQLDFFRRELRSSVDAVRKGKLYIHIVSSVPSNEVHSLQSRNLACIRGSVVRSYFKQSDKLGNNSFIFSCVASDEETVTVSLVENIPSGASTDIYYTAHSDNPSMIRAAMGKYTSFPWESSSVQQESMVTQQPSHGEIGDTLRTKIQLYFRFDKSILDSGYMSNSQSLKQLESLLAKDRTDRMDSLKIEAYASPEGHPDYNRRLSERRGKEVKNVLLWKFPYLDSDRIVYKGNGENWVGLREIVEGDANTPSRDRIIKILNAPLSELERDRQLQRLDGGIPYRYLYQNYYKGLRNASSVFLTLVPKKDTITEVDAKGSQGLIERDTIYITRIDTIYINDCLETYRFIRPLALKTNLLFDLATVLNIELEIPINKKISILGEYSFPWFGGLKSGTHYTAQMLSWGLEGRYWFYRNKKLDARSKQWGDYNPLTGWFVGLYTGGGLYDWQLGGDGVQGEFLVGGGLSAGYAHPVGKHFHMEYSLGVGYMKTDYRLYKPIDDHKVYQSPDRRLTWIGPTKAKVSLVWIPQFKIKSKKK